MEKYALDLIKKIKNEQVRQILHLVGEHMNDRAVYTLAEYIVELEKEVKR